VNEVVFIGTSDAFGAGGRRQSAVLVRGPSGTALLDCGASTGSGLNELGIATDEIDTILVSHFHGDHFGGIPLLLLAALYEDARTRPLQIGGPPGIEARLKALATSMGHPLGNRDWTFPIEFHELHAGEGCEVGPVRARAFATHHSPDAAPHGLRLDLGGPTVAYSGDTGWFDGLPRQVAGAELFICECTYHTSGFQYHLSHEELVAQRNHFDCGRMLITHLGAEMADRRSSCDFEAADDGLKVRI